MHNIIVTAAQAKARSKNARYGGYEDSILQDTAPLCPGHQQPSKLIKVNKSGPNKGRKFYSCCMDQDQQCKFFLWAEDNPALIALTLADNAATAERDRLLGPEEAKRAAVVRSFCHKVSLLTRPELRREIQKFKKRREQCAYLGINSGSIKEMRKEQDKGRRKNKTKNKSDHLFPLTVGGSRQELLDLLEQEATRLIHHFDFLSEGMTGGGQVSLKSRVTPCADSDEGAAGGKDVKRDVKRRGAQSVVVKKSNARSDDGDNSEGNSDEDDSEDDRDNISHNSSSSSIEIDSNEEEDEKEEDEEDDDDESDIDIVDEELNGDEKLSKPELMIMLSSDDEDSVSSSPSSSPSYSERCRKRRKLTASTVQGVEGMMGKDVERKVKEGKGIKRKEGKEWVEEAERVRGAEWKEGVEDVEGRSSSSSSSSTALRPIDVALRYCFGYSSFRPGQR